MKRKELESVISEIQLASVNVPEPGKHKEVSLESVTMLLMLIVCYISMNIPVYMNNCMFNMCVLL